MEAQESMELRDLPVDTRNYTIIDNITGKPIDQSNYSLTIDPEVIDKLNALKKVNEEKVKQATLRGLYQDVSLVETFTPEDNSVFTPVYEGEYISDKDYNTAPDEQPEEPVEEKEEETFNPTEVLQQDTLLERVVARDPSVKKAQEELEKESQEQTEENEENGISDENQNQEEVTYENSVPAQDNSTFTPEMAGLKEASEQIIQIDAEKLGPAIKPPKHSRPKDTKVKLDVMEIRQAKGYAWLAYLLFFIPLLINRKNRFARIHANEGLELNLMEILGVLLVLPYFLISTTEMLHTVLFVLALAGIVLLGMCALTIIPMMICAMCGLQFQIPWLWKKRMIKVAETRE